MKQIHWMNYKTKRVETIVLDEDYQYEDGISGMRKNGWVEKNGVWTNERIAAKYN